MNIIGLTGRARHGKNTAASLIAEAWTRSRSKSVATMAFADALKREAAESFGVDSSLFFDDHKKDYPQRDLTLRDCNNPSFVQLCLAQDFPVLLDEPQRPRFIAQMWGTEFRRSQNPDYWVNQLQRDLVDAKSRGFGLAVVTDVRFENEANMLRNAGAEIWKIYRPQATPLRAGALHASERQMESMRVDATFTNDTIESLEMAIVDSIQGVGR